MRKRKYKKAYPAVGSLIAKHFKRLRRDIVGNDRRKEDAFEETVLFVIHDYKALTCKDEAEFIAHFKIRFKMIEFQMKKDYKQIKEITYADYLQARKEIQEE